MSSTPTTRNRLLKQGAGDNVNTWGDQQSSGDFDMIDVALDGVLSLTVSGNVTLSTANYVDDQARRRSIKITSASSVSATITLPAVEKWYPVWNASSYDQIIATSGGGTSVTVKAGELVPVLCDATNVARMTLLTMGGARLTNLGTPTASTDATTKAYVDSAISATAFSMGSFGVPIGPGDSGKFLTNNGSTASWAAAVTPSRQVLASGLVTGGGALSGDVTLTVTAAAAADVRAGTDATKAATASALAGSAAFISLTDAATIAWDVSQGYNARVTLTASGHTIGAPTNLADGVTYSLEVIQDATGSRTVSWNTIWDFGANGLPVLQTGAGKADKIHGQYNARTGKIECSFRKGA